MIHTRLIYRQLLKSKRQGVVFILCVTLSVVSLIAIDGLKSAIENRVSRDAKSIHGADILISSYDPIEGALAKSVEALEKKETIVRAETVQFHSVILDPDKKRSLLAQIKGVSFEYPLYGQVVLASGRPLGKVLENNQVVVEKGVLDQLNLKVHDTIHIGKARFTIEDVILSEPDRPLRVFSLGPRVLVSMDQIKKMDLIQKGSRIRYVQLIKPVDETKLNTIITLLKPYTADTSYQLHSYKTAPSGMKRFFTNFLFFLRLVGVMIFLLSGIGIYRSVNALISDAGKSIAIMKTVGADNRFMVTHFSLIVVILGMIGTLAGVLAGGVLQLALNHYLTNLLSEPLHLSITVAGTLKGVIIGIFGSFFFSLHPLFHLKSITPMAIFRESTPTIRSLKTSALLFLLSALISFLYLRWQSDTHMEGVKATLAIFSFILVSALLSKAMLFILKKIPFKKMVLIHAVKSMMRPGNASSSAIITLLVSMGMIFLIVLLEKNLTENFIKAFPEDAPNLYFIDIQPAEQSAFENALGHQLSYYPVVRARITHINSEPISTREEEQKKGDNLSRVFNLTFRKHLLEDETIIKGSALFDESITVPQVSIMDTIVSMKKMRIGDMISFKIQGVPLTARISSIRKQTGRSLTPFFYFVFPPDILKEAPHTLFAAIRLKDQDISEIRTRMVKAFPHITVIDLNLTLKSIVRILINLSKMVGILSLLSILAGLFILISAVLATFSERIREAVYYKILGARSSFILLCFTAENLLIGLLSAIPALFIAQGVAFYICHYQWEIPFSPLIFESFAMIVITLLSITGIIVLFSFQVITEKPATYLREQHNE